MHKSVFTPNHFAHAALLFQAAIVLLFSFCVSWHADIAPAATPGAQAGVQSLTFNVPVSAPPGGLLIDVTTDVPESVIMPEIIVPQGQTSVTITVEGGKPGNGSLFLKGYGAGEVTIPVSVGAK